LLAGARWGEGGAGCPTFKRDKFIFVHFNGPNVAAVKRGRCSAQRAHVAPRGKNRVEHVIVLVVMPFRVLCSLPPRKTQGAPVSVHQNRAGC